MDSTEFAANLFSSIVPVTAAIYKNGKEKADVKWSFEISVSPSDSALANFKKRLYETYGTREKCLELQIENFVIKLQNIKHQGIPAGPLLTYKLEGQKPPSPPCLPPQLQFFTVFCPPSIWSLFSFCCS